MRSEQAVSHLLLRMRPIHRALEAAVQRQHRLAARLHRPEARALCITADQVDGLLQDVKALGTNLERQPFALNDAERNEEEALRSEAGGSLPLDRLQQSLALEPFQIEALLLCLAPEIDRNYERIYAYILDDLNRRFPCIELVCNLTAITLGERLSRRHFFSLHGTLLRTGLLRIKHEAPATGRQELLPGAGLLDYLCDGKGDPAQRFADPHAVSLHARVSLPPNTPSERIDRLAHTLRDDAMLAVGVWGPRHAGRDACVHALARRAGMPLRRLPIPENLPNGDALALFQDAEKTAAEMGALLWVDCDALHRSEHALDEVFLEAIAATATPVCLSGRHPWRPTALLGNRNYDELTLKAPSYLARKTMWTKAARGIDDRLAGDLAARFRLGFDEMAAACRLAQHRARLQSNGRQVAAASLLTEACTIVTRKKAHRFTMPIAPKRTAADLILSPSLHRQVLEIGRFYRVGAHVDEAWGFGRLQTGPGGMKVLFTGDSGTGKTLAAEVIAGELGLSLLSVDLAQLVSKWVGETEKNLDTVFTEAEEGNAVLFFDEADALFGRRGKVQHGTDRYANLEVGYLLQRLEQHDGLVILASNLKSEIDAAFLRRFQVVLHFPRPLPLERRRIWELALPKMAPLSRDIDIACLEKLDLTGAGIVASARTAALMAADDAADTITMGHLVRAVSRQYRREDRVLTPPELGVHAALLGVDA